MMRLGYSTFFCGCLLLAGVAAAAEMPSLSKKHQCDGCHDVDKKLVGPSWMEISKKYKGAAKYSYGGREYALEDGLVKKVSMGGSGNWGKMPMPPNDPNETSQAEMRALVRYILSLAK